MAVTIKDIAKLSGVSIATVSRVLNNRGGYSKKVEQEILAIARETGYIKNENASTLARQSSRTIGVIMPNLPTSFYEIIINSIEEYAGKKDYEVIFTHSGVDGENTKSSLNLMLSRRVAGIIIISVYLDEEIESLITKRKIPVVLIATESENNILPYVKSDDYQMAYDATSYLINKGHRKIGLAGLNFSDPIAGIPRIQGYKDALTRNDIPIKEEYITNGEFSYYSGEDAMKYYLDNDIKLTAIYCASDETALGVMSVCYNNGISVPNDISILGNDNSTISSMVSPAITTVSQSFYEMGKAASEKLINYINNDTKPESAIFPTEIIERKSVK